MVDPVIIGDATLYLADCLEILPTLGKADAVVTDPPYEERIQKNIGGRKRNDGSKAGERLAFAGIDNNRMSFIKQASSLCAGWFIVFSNVEGVGRWRDDVERAGMKYRRAMIWVKPDSMPQLNGNGPANAAEAIIAAWFGAGHSSWNSGGKRGVYTYSQRGGRHGGHPTEKPVRLMAEILADFTTPGQMVLDPFMGIGATGVACARMGRQFIGVEQRRGYFDIACRRIEDADKQPDMFVEPPSRVVQEGLDLGAAKARRRGGNGRQRA